MIYEVAGEQIELTRDEEQEILSRRKSTELFNDKIASVLDDPDISDTEVGRIFRAYFNMRIHGVVPDFSDDRFLRKSFEQLASGDSYSDRKYIETTLRNRRNGAKGSRPKKEGNTEQTAPNIPENPVGFNNNPVGHRNNPVGAENNPSGFFKNPTEPKKPDTDTDTDTETDTDTDTDTDTGRGAGETYTFFRSSADTKKQAEEQLRRYFIKWQFEHMEQLNAEHITITLDDFMEQCRIVWVDGNIELTALKALQRLTG